MIIPTMQSPSTPVNDGREDVRRAVAELAGRLPDPLAPLARLAYNYRWSWLPGAPELFRAIDPERFEISGQNPVRLLQETSTAALRRAAGAAEMLEQARDAGGPARRRSRPGPRGRSGRPRQSGCIPMRRVRRPRLAAGVLGRARARSPVICSRRPQTTRCRSSPWASCTARATFASGSTPSAGSTSTGSTPTPSGCRRRSSPAADGEPRDDDGADLRHAGDCSDLAGRGRAACHCSCSTPTSPANGHARALDHRAALRRRLRYPACPVRAARRRRDPGAAGDGDRARHDPPERGPCRRSRRSSWRAPSCATAPARSTRRSPPRGRAPSSPPIRPSPPGTTPIPRIRHEQAIGALAGQLGIDIDRILALGRTNPEDAGEPFGVTQAALHLSRAANAVSARHGEVAREMWRTLWPERDVDQVPIRHVTNGVHIPTWIGTADARAARPPSR